ncbi:MAG: hypothetical protein DRJ13_10340, partial [Bacteroidetes bacterium]
ARHRTQPNWTNPAGAGILKSPSSEEMDHAAKCEKQNASKIKRFEDLHTFEGQRYQQRGQCSCRKHNDRAGRYTQFSHPFSNGDVTEREEKRCQ